jgi:DNA-binding NarL/FixJ family response regulator
VANVSAPKPTLRFRLKRVQSASQHWPVAAPGRTSIPGGNVSEDVRLALEEAAVAASQVAEHALNYAGLLDEALSILAADHENARPATIQSAALAPNTQLSPRESEVLALVAQGLTNKAIAETLFVSPNTVKSHVSSLLSKFNVDSRVQLAALAERQRLQPVPG